SLLALGGVLVMRQAISKASVQWRGGVQLSIFLNPQATKSQISGIGDELKTAQGVKRYHYVDKPQAYREFKTIFGGNATIADSLSVNDMPPSYRVVPTKAQDIAQLGNQFNRQPGVYAVTYPQKAIQDQLHRFNEFRVVGIVLAIAVMVGAIALIVNTIQLAIFARRREVAVMKLVGATNWFIRIPFMLEGMIQGLVGAIVASVVVYFLRGPIAGFIGNVSDQVINNQLYVTPSEAIGTGVIILIVGVLVGVLGSAFAVRRFLAV
ncbi:MAG: ABC transporter permease, partial [Acidimicrobiaceae bacterium]|nr:ABC transporter permease [Acidimicrobiaceae bacterium]